jgi:hypothetical protein
LEPAIISGLFSDVKGVDTAWERVQANDNAHVVLLDGIGGDLLQPILLVAMIQGGSGNLDPCCVCGWDTESVDALGIVSKCQIEVV